MTNLNMVTYYEKYSNLTGFGRKLYNMVKNEKYPRCNIHQHDIRKLLVDFKKDPGILVPARKTNNI